MEKKKGPLPHSCALSTAATAAAAAAAAMHTKRKEMGGGRREREREREVLIDWAKGEGGGAISQKSFFFSIFFPQPP